MAVIITPTTGPIETIGTYMPVASFKATTLGTTTVDLKIPGMKVIAGAVIQILDSGNNVVTSDADITWYNDIITIADGSSFSLTDTYIIYGFCWGIVNA